MWLRTKDENTTSCRNGLADSDTLETRDELRGNVSRVKTVFNNAQDLVMKFYFSAALLFLSTVPVTAMAAAEDSAAPQLLDSTDVHRKR